MLGRYLVQFLREIRGNIIYIKSTAFKYVPVCSWDPELYKDEDVIYVTGLKLRYY